MKITDHKLLTTSAVTFFDYHTLMTYHTLIHSDTTIFMATTVSFVDPDATVKLLLCLYSVDLIPMDDKHRI